MKERPIIFSGEMVRAILDGRKTQTRRVIKNVPAILLYPQIQDAGVPIPELIEAYKKAWLGACPYGHPGDRLWVRENIRRGKEGNLAFYAADEGLVTKNGECVRWIFNEPHVPSIHMPRWASRITLEITDVRVERLKNITNNDALAEGVPDIRDKINNFDMRDCFAPFWDSLNAKRGFGWDVNPWVWVISFKRIEQGRKA
jgi:hypothetical protein